MYFAVAKGSIQRKSRFREAEGESRNSLVVVSGCWYLIRIVLKVGGILAGLKILRE